ncbi:MAG: sigma-54 dependent transcriptional regulator [Deltaproteobacteria bacterium]|jgi:two-component system NtrC family response regulator|nr:sigma-54 dependent transcriptional regulator [Deltaproteobacteria bacterium]
MYAILIVDDEIKLREVLCMALENLGYRTCAAETAEAALAVLREREIHLVLSDLRLPGLSGRELLNKVKSVAPALPVVIMTAYASLKDAVEIIKEGAFDYIVKPFDLNTLEVTIAKALRFYALSRDNALLRRELGQTYASSRLIGESPAFQALRKSILEVSSSSANVLISGESGTGKELVAKAIHYGGARASAPLVTINCAAIPEALLESELFGHVKGAFTGAGSNRTGRVAQADSGTIFLDEIGDMPLPLQAKILRCIQEKTIEPVGSHETRKVDVRVIAATNRNLQDEIGRGNFRQDLYYRLNVYPIVMPPLRERKEDIPVLADHFAARIGVEMGKSRVEFTPEAVAAMQNYAWPGNVRELENCVERLTIVAVGEKITLDKLAACAVLDIAPEDAHSAARLPAGLSSVSVEAGFPLNLERSLETLERELVCRALEETGGIQVKAAELLGISERSIWHRIKKLSIAIRNKKEIR